MDRVILTVSSELFDDMYQEASVQGNLPVHRLIAEIQREFSLPEGNYTLSLKGSDQQLDLGQTLDQLGIQTGAELVFGRERRRLSQQIIARGGSFFQAITGSVRAALKENRTGTIFEIEWQPAIIGRPDASHAASSDMLAVNLGSFEGARSVSRQHARVTEHHGQYYIESLSERNPTYLNGEEVLFGEKRGLEDDDQIRVGKFVLTFSVRRL